MRHRWWVPAVLWGIFTTYSIVVSVRGGALGFLSVPRSHPWGLQVLLDLFVSLVVALRYLAPKARRLGVPVSHTHLALPTYSELQALDDRFIG